MKIIYNSLTSKHIGNKLECPERVSRIKCEHVEIDRQAAIKAIQDLYYDKLTLKTIRKSCEYKCDVAESKLNMDSYEAIIASIGLCLIATAGNDFALVRPPGHHANIIKSRGFCIINNIAVVVNKLICEGKKVAIIDFDGHHGDGTHDFFKNNENVLFCSLFQMNAYPYVSAHDVKINKMGVYVALNPGSGDDLFQASICLFLEKIKEFAPDVVAVSAGFDGYFSDPLLDLCFTEHSYYYVGNEIGKLNIPTFAVLEGGYHGDLDLCVRAFVSGFNNDPFEFINEKTKTRE